MHHTRKNTIGGKITFNFKNSLKNCIKNIFFKTLNLQNLLQKAAITAEQVKLPYTIIHQPV